LRGGLCRSRTEGVPEAFVGEVVLAEHVDGAPADHGVTTDRVDEVLLLVRVADGPKPVLEAEVVPAHDGVLDEAVAALGDLLAFLVGLLELVRVAVLGLHAVVRMLDLPVPRVPGHLALRISARGSPGSRRPPCRCRS
jgi:hypothetical protein